MFATTMNLPKEVSPKINRDFISVLTDYIAPSSLAKTSTTEQMASHFHHSQLIHDMFYSADTFRRDNDGNMIPGPLTVAQQIWSALGEDLSHHKDYMRPIVEKKILTKTHYDHAAKRAYSNPTASVTELQYSAINFAASSEIHKHAFVFMGCGMGKSGIYNLLLLGAYLNRTPIPKILVISPHNSLLAMHVLQSKHYLRGTSLKVLSLLPIDIQKDEIPAQFDLMFISIHAFNDLMIDQQHIFKQWCIDNIFIDEYHNMVGELFRFTTSWQSLRHCASLNAKMMFLSATTDSYLMASIAKFMSIVDYDVIGSISTYSVPNVRIVVIKNTQDNEREFLLDTIIRHCKNIISKKSERRFKIHAITMSRQDASDLSDRLNIAGIQSMWLTSSQSTVQKSQYLQLWEDGDEKVLVSTFTDGIDNSSTEDVIIVGGTYSIYSLVQAIGRIRPKRQSFTNSSVFIFHSSKYVQFEQQTIDDNVSRATGGNILSTQDGITARTYYQKMFHITGYNNWIKSSNVL